MDVLRANDAPVTQAQLDVVWSDPVQRLRAQDSLVADGLIDQLPDGSYGLPTRPTRPARPARPQPT